MRMEMTENEVEEKQDEMNVVSQEPRTCGILISIISRAQACVYDAAEFFVAWQGVLTIAFCGIPNSILQATILKSSFILILFLGRVWTFTVEIVARVTWRSFVFVVCNPNRSWLESLTIFMISIQQFFEAFGDYNLPSTPL